MSNLVELVVVCTLARLSLAGCIPFDQAHKHIGETRCITGKVVRVEAGSKGTHYLDFCDDYRFCGFTVVVFSHDLENIGDVRQLAGKLVEIRGEVKEYDDRAEIILEAVSSFLGSSHAAAFAEEFRRGTARPFQRRKIPCEKEPDDAQEEGNACDAGRDSGRCGIGIEGQCRLHQPLPQLL